jgi:hypothetical protein
MIGGPSWIDTDRFDVDATGGSTAGPDAAGQMRLMIQSLLEEGGRADCAQTVLNEERHGNTATYMPLQI